MTGRDGTNLLNGQGGDDIMSGNSGNDTLRGEDGDDHLFAGGGRDLLAGGAGNDVLEGGVGDDTASYLSAEGSVRVSLLLGTIQNTKSAGFDTITNIENLIGSVFSDSLNGDGFANTLEGKDGNDRLSGGFNFDTLIGGEGGDRLTGGAGADVFAFTSIRDFGTNSRDVITDFSHADIDRIDLSLIDADRRTADDQGFAFIGSAAFSVGGSAVELRVEEAGDGRYLVQGDLNHDGVADFAFDVHSDGPLVAEDFRL